MNRKAIEMAITTLILIVIGVLVLIGLIYAITGGFKTFSSSTKPFTDTTTSTAIKLACTQACDNSDRLTYCCEDYPIDDMNIKCNDQRLELGCSLDCTSFSCETTLTAQQCESQGGTVVGDPGDGSVSGTKTCPGNGEYIGQVPLGIEGSICCK